MFVAFLSICAVDPVNDISLHRYGYSRTRERFKMVAMISWGVG